MRPAEPVFPTASWRKSSYSGSQGECVEVARGVDMVGVRDTKHRDGGTLHLPASAWRAFTARV